jgi:hypothetical protein
MRGTSFVFPIGDGPSVASITLNVFPTKKARKRLMRLKMKQSVNPVEHETQRRDLFHSFERRSTFKTVEKIPPLHLRSAPISVGTTWGVMGEVILAQVKSPQGSLSAHRNRTTVHPSPP